MATSASMFGPMASVCKCFRISSQCSHNKAIINGEAWVAWVAWEVAVVTDVNTEALKAERHAAVRALRNLDGLHQGRNISAKC